jgi:hypothetical protein
LNGIQLAIVNDREEKSPLGPKVRMSKIDIAENPSSPTPSAENYTPGLLNEGVSLPLEYTVEGYLEGPLEKGCSIDIDRRKRNGIEVRGFLHSSPIQEIQATLQGTLVTTANSIYLIEYL